MPSQIDLRRLDIISKIKVNLRWSYDSFKQLCDNSLHDFYQKVVKNNYSVCNSMYNYYTLCV